MTAAAAVAAVVGRWLAGRGGAASSRADLTLPTPERQLPLAPSSVEAGVDGIAPFFTPNADFYRIDTALTVPQVPVDGWSLSVKGLVDEPFELDFDELVSLGLVEEDITLTCVSNTVGGNLVGNARWTGVPLDRILERAGVQAGADQIVGRSTDGYTCGFPVSALDGRPAIVAVAMNGEPLPLEHGFPARLLVAGLYGYVSATKWLTELELTTFDAFDQYWVDRGWVDDAPIKTMARIDTPRSLQKLPAGTIPIGGVAWAQTRGIEAVELSIDDGPFEPCELAESLNDNTWRQWSFPWDATPGRHRLTVRAVDGTGETQIEERAEPFPSGASGWMSLFVEVTDA
ncbi:MAG: molybdopterin-dependent oxidoreductase [Ilumatobacteraceae bacterium]